jgi:hypothetical protein
MMMTRDEPNPRIVDRAVELWKRMLANPEYKATCDDSGLEDQITMARAASMAKMIPSNATPERLEAFGVALKQRLMTPDPQRSSCVAYPDTLHVDYGPDAMLGGAAEEAGLKLEWPWKTLMRLYDDRVGLAAGYAAGTVYHYPLNDGRWLMTTLQGSDITKIIEYVDGGQPEFDIEATEAPLLASAPSEERP